MILRRQYQWFVLLSCALASAGTAARAEDEPFADLLRRARKASQAIEWSEAAALWERVVRANPVNGSYWLDLGSARYGTKEYRAAAAAFARAFELGAGSPAETAYNLARCHGRLNEKDQAFRWLEAASKKGFRNLGAARSDSAFASLREEPRFQEMAGAREIGKLSRDEGWRFDLHLLAREIKRRHYDPFRKVTREEFDAYVQKVHDEIPSLTDNQAMVALMKLGCLAGGGHMWVRSEPRQVLPVQLFSFTEGVFVTTAAPDHADLAGCQVVKVGGRPVLEVIRALEPVIHRDNETGFQTVGVAFLTVPRILNGMGLIPDGDRATLTVRDATGKERDVTLTAGTALPNDKWISCRQGATKPVPLYLKNRRANYWFEHLPDRRTVYFQYNSVRNDLKEPIATFCDRLFKFIDGHEVDKLVIDARWNGGGNSFLNRPIVHGLIRCPKINQRGKLYVIIGRHTFSAAQNFITDIELHTNAIFVGEPSGSSPNSIGENTPLFLPYSKMRASVSNLFWQHSWPMDDRTWTPPELYAPPSFTVFKANRDPALEAIFASAKVAAGQKGQ